MHGCRIAAWYDSNDASSSTYGSAIASGRHVYWSQVHLQQQQLQPEQQGKEGVLLPLRLQAPAVLQLQLPQHAGEVQSLALCSNSNSSSSLEQVSEVLLATVDAYGAGSISRLRPAQQYAVTAAAAGSEDDSSATPTARGPAEGPELLVHAPIRPMDTCREGGWAGVAFSGSSSGSSGSDAAAAGPSLLATARCFAKDVCVYDVATGKALRNFACMHNPYALSFLPAGVASSSDASVVAVAEGHSLALWDVRAAGAAGGCVQRCNPGALGQPLYALAWTTAQVSAGWLVSSWLRFCVEPCSTLAAERVEDMWLLGFRVHVHQYHVPA
jgi:hypothetical protein